MNARKTLITRGAILTLVGVLTWTEPLTLLAQDRGGLRLNAPTGDPVLDDVARNLEAVQRDIRARGLKAEHLRTHAAGLRVAAQHITLIGLNDKVMAWAKAQDPSVFQFQVFDPADVARVRTRLEQQGFSTEAIGAVLNSSPDVKVRALTLLRTKGPSGVMLDLAAALDERATARLDSPGGAVVRHVRMDCYQVNDMSGIFGVASFVFGALGPEAWPLSFAFGFDSSLLYVYSKMQCPGLSWFFQRYQPPLERRPVWSL